MKAVMHDIIKAISVFLRTQNMAEIGYYKIKTHQFQVCSHDWGNRNSSYPVKEEANKLLSWLLSIWNDNSEHIRVYKVCPLIRTFRQWPRKTMKKKAAEQAFEERDKEKTG